MKVTVICPDVSENSLGRALLLADMLGRHHDVELIGSILGDGIWHPGRDRAFHALVRGMRWPCYAVPAARLLHAISGDVVYAIKPLPTSFGVALVHRARTGTPVVLDVDDDELAFAPAPAPWNLRRHASALAAPNGRPWARMAAARIPAANAITVASTVLQARHGGTLVPHAKDTTVLRPAPGQREAGRNILGTDDARIVLFAGTPRPFKGIEDAVAAVARMRHPARLVVAGASEQDPYVTQLRQHHPEIAFHPPFPPGDLAPILAAADAVVVPQRRDPRTAAQLPSKLLDAMAMARPVVATAVSDIPDVLAGGRGIVVPPGDPGAMAMALDSILGDEVAAAAMGTRARDWCAANASFTSVTPILRGLFAGLARRR